VNGMFEYKYVAGSKYPYQLLPICDTLNWDEMMNWCSRNISDYQVDDIFQFKTAQDSVYFEIEFDSFKLTEK
jgi:hypothetical protein